MRGGGSTRFFSLHWKGLLALSLLLIGLSATFAVLNYVHLKSQFRTQQDIRLSTLRSQFKGMIERSTDRLERLGLVLAALGDFEQLSTKGGKAEFGKQQSRYASMRYELDVERMGFFTPEGESLWQWSPTVIPDLSHERQQAALKDVRENERPVSVFGCEPVCTLHVFVPVLQNRRNHGIIQLSQRIADLVIDFRALTNTDLAILVPAEPTAPAELKHWQLRTAALSSAQTLTELMQHLDERFRGPRALSKQSWLSWQGKDYSLHAIPLAELTGGGEGVLLFIADVSVEAAEVRRGIQEGLWVTGAALVVAELLLLLLVRLPLLHLKRLAEALPLLAQGGYGDTRRRLNQHAPSARLRDEIDILTEASVRLSYQLEQTHHALTAERDFVQGLFDTAQVLILTQTGAGHVDTVNEFTAQLMGLSTGELSGKRFVDLIEVDHQDAELRQQLETLVDHLQRRLEHESVLLCADGRMRHVVWVHTRLRQEHADGVAVLSVGLDVTDRIEAESRMRWLASHDSLTGLVNRARFREEVEQSFLLAQRGSHSALLLFDLDHFKDINDSSGHPAGDALLTLFADQLRTCSRKTDVLARLGGDEFAVLLRESDRVGAERYAEHITRQLDGMPFHFEGRSYRVSASIGIALIPQHGNSVEEIMANVDIAMYQAKRTGRCRWHIFSYSEGERSETEQRVYWRSVITKCLAEVGGAILHFQPVVRAVSGDVVYHEALIRLRLDDGRIAFPGEFLDAAMRSQLMYAIDSFVTAEALRILKNDQSARLSVNLSAAALDDPRWAQGFKDAVRDGELDPSRVHFEITETAAIADLKAAQKIMDDLNHIGFAFALDDFGAGFASFFYLKHLPIKYVKIDRSFISKLATDKGDRAFVTALTALAHGYDQKVIAEGVEDGETLALLRDLGVDFLQGYFIGRPGPARLETAAGEHALAFEF